MPQKQERFVRMEINFILGKNGDHMPSSLGGRLIFVVRQASRQTTCSKYFLPDHNLQNFKNIITSILKCMFRLFEWIYGANSFVPIDEWPVFGGKIIVRLLFQTWEAIYSLSIPIIKYYRT